MKQLRRAIRMCCGSAAMLALPASLFCQSLAIRGFPADALPEQSRLERILRSTPDTSFLREYLYAMSEAPHHAGSPGSKAVAEYALGLFRSWGLDASIEQYEVLLPMPLERHVELLSPTSYVTRLEEEVFAEDDDTRDAGQVPPFNAFSADGDVTGELVFVNFGLPEDYATLQRLGIDVRGRIVIAKYGRSWRGIKPKVAAENGAIACIMYSDPEEDGYYVDDPYPVGPMRPNTGVQRGSVMDMPLHPGDPLTPGWGATREARRLDRSEAATIMDIPVLPISHADALPLLRALGGPVAPNDDWKGALPLTYHIGPGPAMVRVALSFEWQVRPIYDVVVRILGARYPDQWVIQGNHHDAWVNGAQDPLSGAAALMETARSFSELLKTGWRPERTLIFALWDAEEWGLMGSTEWGEDHAEELRENAVAYFNTDSYSSGWLGVSGSHTLQTFFGEIARDTRDPVAGKSALVALMDRAVQRANTAEDTVRAMQQEFRIGALGSGSDYTVFVDHLNIASANIGFGGAQTTGIYHSIYDTYEFFTRFHDPTFVYGQTLAGTMAVAMLRMADAPVLPFSFSDAATTYARYADEIQTLAFDVGVEGVLDLTNLRYALEHFADAATSYDLAFESVLAGSTETIGNDSVALREINRMIYLSERDLGHDNGLPRRSWFRHTIYAPGFYTGYGVKTMPAVREALEQGNLAEAQEYAAVVAMALERLASRVDVLAARLREIT